MAVKTTKLRYCSCSVIGRGGCPRSSSSKIGDDSSTVAKNNKNIFICDHPSHRKTVRTCEYSCVRRASLVLVLLVLLAASPLARSPTVYAFRPDAAAPPPAMIILRAHYLLCLPHTRGMIPLLIVSSIFRRSNGALLNRS